MRAQRESVRSFVRVVTRSLRGAWTGLGLLLVACALPRPASAQCLEWDARFALDLVEGSVYALAVHDDGTGPALYAGGTFTKVDGVTASNVARWDGTSWSPLGAGLGGPAVAVRAFASFDDGSGPALYVAGLFTRAGGVPVSQVARWDGASWSDVGGGFGSFTGSPQVWALAVHDDGSGPALYAGGRFQLAGGATARSIARWDGTAWSEVGGGIGPAGSAQVNALDVYDDGAGPALYAGGNFASAGATPAPTRRRAPRAPRPAASP